MNLNILVRFQYLKNLQKRRETNRERARVLAEVLSTEEEYVNTLKFLMVECKDILVRHLSLSDEEFNEIFGCIDGIYMLHSEMLKELEERFRSRSDPAFRFGDVLCKYLPFFKVYSSYIRTLDSRRNELIELKSEGKLDKYKQILKQNEKVHSEKNYSAKTLQYLANIELADYMNIPNHRLFLYELMLSRYVKVLSTSSADYKPIREALTLYRDILNKINAEFGENDLRKCMELDKKFGGVVQPQRKFKGEFPATYWAGGSRVLPCRIYIMNDLLLIVDEATGNMVRRMKMDAQSWFHRLNVGKNITTAIFLKGTEGSYQTVFLSNYYLDEFLAVVKKLFSELPNRLSLKNDKPTLIIRPVNVSRQGKHCIFTLYIKIYGARGGIFNSYTIPQLEKIMEHLIEKHGKLFRTLEDVSEMPIGGLESDGISDFDAEHIALIMFQYFGPLLCNFDLTRADPTFQYLMGIRDYVAAHLGEVKYDQKVNPLAQQVLELEGRVRVEELENTQRVQVNIHTESGYKRKLIIGKEERNCSIIRRIFGGEFSLDFAIFLNSDTSKMRILDDDDILYRVMKREGYAFKEQTSYLMKSIKLLDGLFGAKEVTVHLRKYLYLESPYPELLESVGQERLAFLTDNILSIMYQQRLKLSIGKVAEMLGLVMRLKDCGITAQQQQQLVSDYWRGKVQTSKESEGSFRNMVFMEYDRYTKLSYTECFVKLFSSVEFWALYSYAVDCVLSDSRLQAKLIIKHRVLEIRESIDSESPLLRLQLSDLEYSVTPSYIRFKAEAGMVQVEVDWVYGLVLVIERNRQLQRVKNPLPDRNSMSIGM